MSHLITIFSQSGTNETHIATQSKAETMRDFVSTHTPVKHSMFAKAIDCAERFYFYNHAEINDVFVCDPRISPFYRKKRSAKNAMKVAKKMQKKRNDTVELTDAQMEYAKSNPQVLEIIKANKVLMNVK